MFNKYYQDELAFLREMGREFARARPEAAHFLGEAGADPDVERLLEGFSFLSARIRQKLDDEIPELTHSLLEMCWPHYLRPIPALAIVQFQPGQKAKGGGQLIPRGTELAARAVEGTQCRFRTTADVELSALSLTSAELQEVAPFHLRLRLRTPPGMPLGMVRCGALRLHLCGEAAASRALYLCLVRYHQGVWARDAGGGGREAIELKGARIEPAGLGAQESLLPYPVASFPGFRLLQEYFAFPARFLFVDLVGLEGLEAFAASGEIEIELRFSSLPHEMPPVGAANFQLNCTPAVNLFEHDSEPVRVDPGRTDYLVTPAGGQPEHFEIYSIDEVSGLTRGDARRRIYSSIYSFRGGSGEGGEGGDGEVYYRPRTERSIAFSGTDVFLSFVTPRGTAAVADIDVISARLTCTNRLLPHKLGLGDICEPTPDSPDFATFRNITPPTPSIPPPLGDDLHWKLLSHFALNYLSLLDVQHLRELLALYDFPARVDRRAEQSLRLKLEGLRSIRAERETRLLRGLPVRGIAVHLELAEEEFGGEGEIYLFGTVLNEFFAHYVSLNTYSRLVVSGTKYGETHEWSPRTGMRTLL